MSDDKSVACPKDCGNYVDIFYITNIEYPLQTCPFVQNLFEMVASNHSEKTPNYPLLLGPFGPLTIKKTLYIIAVLSSSAPAFASAPILFTNVSRHSAASVS